MPRVENVFGHNELEQQAQREAMDWHWQSISDKKNNWFIRIQVLKHKVGIFLHDFI